jgi:hypothetical protein
VLERVPQWAQGFPKPGEMKKREFLKIAKSALQSDPRTRRLPLDKMRKTILRAGYQER